MENKDNELCMLHLIGIAYNQQNTGVYALILQEVKGTRRIPIVIGSAEAQSIECKLQGIITPRPLTHDLMTNIIRACGLHLYHVIIKRLDSGVYAADLCFGQDGHSLVIDARSSDAVALAIRLGVPIYTTSKLLEEVGVKNNLSNSHNKTKLQAESQRELSLKSLHSLSVNELEQRLQHAVDEEHYEDAADIKRELDSRRRKDTGEY